MSVYFGQTTNYAKLVEMVKESGSYPAVAAEYSDNVNAIRVHCGTESQVQMSVGFYCSGPEDFAMLEKFLKYFGLPRNGFHIVNVARPYGVACVQVMPQLMSPDNTR